MLKSDWLKNRDKERSLDDVKGPEAVDASGRKSQFVLVDRNVLVRQQFPTAQKNIFLFKERIKSGSSQNSIAFRYLLGKQVGNEWETIGDARGVFDSHPDGMDVIVGFTEETPTTIQYKELFAKEIVKSHKSEKGIRAIRFLREPEITAAIQNGGKR